MKASSLGGPKPQFVDANGNPYSGAKLFFYAAGSSTKQNTYRDSSGATPNSNPIVLDSSGRPTYEIWFTDGLTYKAVLAPSTDSDPPNSPIFTVDNLAGINDVTASVDEWQASGLTPTYVGATSFTVSGDQTATFTAGRRLKSSNTAGTIYSMVSSSSYSGGTLLTTVTVVNDSGSLDSGLSSVSLSILRADHSSLPHTKSSSAGLQFSKQIEVYGTGTGTSSQLKITRTATGSYYLQVGGSSELIFNNDAGTTTATLDSSGYLQAGPGYLGGSTVHSLVSDKAGSFAIFAGSGYGAGTPNNFTMVLAFCDATGANLAQACAASFQKNNATGRSINLAGTVNASGADYAEYERNNGLTIAKGSIVGFKSDGTLTLNYAEAVRFGVKSTNPAYVGGDVWAAEFDKSIDDMTDAEKEVVETARKQVDRIAYSGKVPCNVYGATPGDYIVAVDQSGAIAGVPVADPDFAQYKKAVGRVNQILEDGRAEIAVIVH